MSAGAGGAELPETVDVLVIGGGLAGHCAAIRARQEGATVALIEKQPEVGGSSLLSGGSFAFAGTEQQSEQGIDDSLDRLRQDLFDVGGRKNDPALVELYVAHQLETYGWLRELGVAFHAVQLSSNMSRPRSHPAFPDQVMAVVRDHVARCGVIAVTHARAAALHREDTNGPVTAVTVEGADGSRRVAVRGGVVLATGGFARSESLVQTFAPDQAPALRLGGEGSTGDGIEMAWALGAGVADVGYVSATFGIPWPDFPGSNRRYDGPRPLTHAMYRGAIIVNRDAQRFSSEANSYKTLGEHCLKQPDVLGFQIFDQSVMAQAVKVPSTHDYDGAQALGLLGQADTIEELARNVGLDPEALAKTVRRYNGFVDEGVDADFGRRTLGKGYGQLVRIETPPFYILPCTAALFTTYGGLKVNDRMEVLHVTGAPIGQLYAAGEVIGGFHGQGYMSGSALGKAAVFGRIAGAHAAADRGRPN